MLLVKHTRAMFACIEPSILPTLIRSSPTLNVPLIFLDRLEYLRIPSSEPKLNRPLVSLRPGHDRSLRSH
jgi:hypothetical protein